MQLLIIEVIFMKSNMYKRHTVIQDIRGKSTVFVSPNIAGLQTSAPKYFPTYSEKIKETFFGICNEEVLKILQDNKFYNFFKVSDKLTLKSYTLSLDIRKSTKLMTICKSPEIYSNFISLFIKSCKEIIKKRNGIYDKFTGDGIICHFIDVEKKKNFNPYKDCIKCSIELHNNFSNVYKKILKEQKIKLDLCDAGIGIGIDYGEVFFRMNTESQDNELFAIGESINYACRLSCAPAFQTYLNTNAYHSIKNSLGNLYEFKKIEHEIKEGNIHIYQLLYGGKNKKINKK